LASGTRIGLMGLGNLGRNVLTQLSERRDKALNLRWVADSSCLVSRTGGVGLGRVDVSRILRAKQGPSGLRTLGAPFVVSEFSNAREESGLLRDLTDDEREDYVVLDTTFMDAADAFHLTSNLMGVLGICTADKTAWADRTFSRRLFSMATERRTFLGLNCTQGVWLDQMEYIPIAAAKLGTRTVRISKRDNSSLNFLFSRASEGLSPAAIYDQLTAGGYLEPGGTDLMPEVKDQQIKARITTNICSIVAGLRVTSREQTLPQILAGGPASASVDDLCSWFVSGKGRGYPALVTEMKMSGQTGGSVSCALGFRVLERTHPLGRDFQGRNTFSVSLGGNRPKNFTHKGGPGGAANTARKMIEEAEEVIRLSGARHGDTFSPLPVLTGLESADRKTVKRARALLKILE
jgi:homoserine dehydrogenase